MSKIITPSKEEQATLLKAIYKEMSDTNFLCPQCQYEEKEGLLMIRRANTEKFAHFFFIGCHNYPKCNYTNNAEYDRLTDSI